MPTAERVVFLRTALIDRMVHPIYTFFHATVVPAAYTRTSQEQGFDIHSPNFDRNLFQEISAACESIKRRQFDQASIRELFDAILRQTRNMGVLFAHLQKNILDTISDSIHDQKPVVSSRAQLIRFLRYSLYFCADQFSKIPCVLDVRCTPDRRITRIQTACAVIRESIEQAIRSIMIGKVLEVGMRPRNNVSHSSSITPPPPPPSAPSVRPPPSPSSHMNAITVKLMSENAILKGQLKEVLNKLMSSSASVAAPTMSMPPPTLPSMPISQNTSLDPLEMKVPDELPPPEQDFFNQDLLSPQNTTEDPDALSLDKFDQSHGG